MKNKRRKKDVILNPIGVIRLLAAVSGQPFFSPKAINDKLSRV